MSRLNNFKIGALIHYCPHDSGHFRDLGYICEIWFDKTKSENNYQIMWFDSFFKTNETESSIKEWRDYKIYKVKNIDCHNKK